MYRRPTVKERLDNFEKNKAVYEGKLKGVDKDASEETKPECKDGSGDDPGPDGEDVQSDR